MGDVLVSATTKLKALAPWSSGCTFFDVTEVSNNYYHHTIVWFYDRRATHIPPFPVLPAEPEMAGWPAGRLTGMDVPE